MQEIVLLHTTLQHQVQELIESNSKQNIINEEIKKQIMQLEDERDNWLSKWNQDQQQLRLFIMKSVNETEDSALNVLEKKINLIEKRIQSLQRRVLSIQQERKHTNNSLIEECVTLRERFHSSYQTKQTRRQLQKERLEEKRAEKMKVTIELEQMEEEYFKNESELNNMKDRLIHSELCCKEWMTKIANVVRSRRNRPSLKRRVDIDSSDENMETVFASFNVLEAFEKQNN